MNEQRFFILSYNALEETGKSNIGMMVFSTIGSYLNHKKCIDEISGKLSIKIVKLVVVNIIELSEQDLKDFFS